MPVQHHHYATNSREIDLSVIVPLYNEEESIQPLYEALMKAVVPLGLRYEIIFVDDGSSDSTFERAKMLALQNPFLRVIKFRRNYGQTPAMAAGIDNARGKILVTMDGDLQNDPEDIPFFLEKIQEGYDIVVGWRFNRQDKMITRKIPSKIANWLIGKVTGVPIKDNGCSLKAYRAEVIKNVPLYSEMHRFIPAMASIAGAKVAEIKVRHHARKFGASKYGLSRIYKVLLDLISIKTIISISPRPVRGFGIVAFLFALVSLTTFVISIIWTVFFPEQSVVVWMGISLLCGANSIFLLSLGMLCDLIYKTGNLRLERLPFLTIVRDLNVENENRKVVHYE